MWNDSISRFVCFISHQLVQMVRFREKLAALRLPKRAPNGSKSDRAWITVGAILTNPLYKNEYESVRLELEKRPDKFECRLILLGYFQQLAWTDKRQSKFSFEHVLWMIDNRPGDYISNKLPFLGGVGSWTPSMRREAQLHWLKQTRDYPDDGRILTNAAEFFEGHTQERLLKKAKLLSPNYAPPVRRLAMDYRALAMWGPVQDRAKYARRAFVEAEIAFALKDDPGERMGMLQEFARTAIKYNKLEKAMAWSCKLLKNDAYSYVYHDYARIFIATILIRTDESKPATLTGHLKKLTESFERQLGTKYHVAYGNDLLLLAEELARSGEISWAQRFLQLAVSSTESEQKQLQLQKWLESIEEGKVPRMNWPSRRRRRIR